MSKEKIQKSGTFRKSLRHKEKEDKEGDVTMSNKVSKGLVLLGISLAVIFLMTACQPASAEKPYISVNGNGNVKAEPDTAEMTITVISESKDKSAQELNAQKADKIIELLKEIGLEEKEIKTVRADFYPNIKWENGKEVNLGYRAENSLQIKTKKLDLLGKITDSAVREGAERVSGLNFSLSTEGKEALLDQVIASATADARSQAEAAAKSLGSNLGDVKSVHIIRENSPQIYRALAGNMMAADSVAREETTIMPGEMDYSINAAVEFFIK